MITRSPFQFPHPCPGGARHGHTRGRRIEPSGAPRRQRQHADLAVGGGAATALTFASEQTATATRVATAGAARHLPGHQADPATVRAAVTELLQDTSYRRSATASASCSPCSATAPSTSREAPAPLDERHRGTLFGLPTGSAPWTTSGSPPDTLGRHSFIASNRLKDSWMDQRLLRLAYLGFQFDDWPPLHSRVTAVFEQAAGPPHPSGHGGRSETRGRCAARTRRTVGGTSSMSAMPHLGSFVWISRSLVRVCR